uniref:b(0,+)-type amino acid transporter 1-like n=1 Tax=Styela clava TaxID=7725 RepID=UPI00193ADB96|nr:b(0,+)-type amino acid transporter 1-like [Styela clava]
MEIRAEAVNNAAHSGPKNSQPKEVFELQKKIGLWRGVSIIAGIMVGSGIFLSPVGVLAGTNGSVGMSLVLWVVCGLFSGLAALCYAELGTTVVESGGDFAYFNAAYGGPVAFAFSSAYLFVIYSTGSAAKAVALGTYIATPFYNGECAPPTTAVKFAGAAAILVVTFVNYFSVRNAARVQVVFTIAKFVGLAAIIIGGITRLADGNPVANSNFVNAFDPKALAGLTATQIGLAFYQGLFSYDGWANLNRVTEEVNDVGKTLPRCIMIAITGVTAFYVLVNIAYFSVLTPENILSSKAVAVTFGYRVFGSFGWIMPLAVCLSIFGSLNGSCLTGGRITFAAARRGHLPQIFSMIHVEHITPGPSLLIHNLLVLIMLIPGDFDTLLNSMSFATWIFYGLGAVGVLVLRKTRPDLPRPYKVPVVIPVIVAIFTVYLTIVPLIENPDISYLYGGIFILCSPIFYFLFVYKKLRLPGMDHFTIFLQKFLDVSPTDWEDKLAINASDKSE